MTAEQKNWRIQEYCNKINCKDCVIEKLCDEIGGDFIGHPEVLDKAYNLIHPDTVDMVNHPPHYCQGGMECIDEMVLIFGKEAVKNFCLCNAWKYRKRALFKNKEEDIKKSDWYIQKYKELTENV